MLFAQALPGNTILKLLVMFVILAAGIATTYIMLIYIRRPEPENHEPDADKLGRPIPPWVMPIFWVIVIAAVVVGALMLAFAVVTRI